jgi:uncharacterized protein (DUF58 family)
MNRRLWLLGLLLYGLVLASLATLSGPLLALAIPLVVYLVAGLLYGPEALKLAVEHELSIDRVSVGQPVVVKIKITNQGERLEEALLEDLVPHGFTIIAGDARYYQTVDHDETVEITYTIRAQRGLYKFAGVRVTAADRLGLFTRSATLPVSSNLTVLPDMPRMRTVAIRPRRTRVYSGLIPARQGGAGITIFGVREYQPGDPLSWINWKASARTPDTYFTNQFEQERVADVGLIIDARLRSNQQSSYGSIFEYSVTATAALADAFLRDGNRVGLLLYGRHLDWTFPGYGKVQRERILRALARAEAGDSLIFDRLEHLPTRFFPAHSQLVFVSPLVNDDLRMLTLLRARGNQVMVISPDPLSFERAHLGGGREVELALRIARLERKLLLKQLSEAGIFTFDWRTSTPFHEAIHVAFSRPLNWFHSLGIEPS